ncbi:MAG: NAD(P)/FAD-dependent oxidoreductase [Proteobacteria bacterium]|nr:NAD(P)/FAD-dependent oxidoreductase [Pseudomonadota bacterium]MCP4918823.1 NAD(P)/FAD-dependent oxidoreductase [Pseudomonadota bacterium]
MRVAVIGGGPAGASCAALLAQHGVEVVLYEKETFPRPHVGESLQPATLELLRHHFGLDFSDAGYANKFGAVYVWGETREPWRVLFDERLEGALDGLDERGLLGGGFEQALQVDRASFDTRILEPAVELGVELVQREVTAAEAEGGLDADVVVDASGQRRLLGRAKGLVRTISDLQCTATYTYVTGAGGFPGVLGRHVQWVVTVPEGWAWFIPISADRTSIGVVNRGRKRLDEQRFREIIREQFPLEGATHEGIHFAPNWSFTSTAFAGDGWYLVGDAACFVDPILSGGVDLAVRSGLSAATAILSGDPATYERELRAQYKAYLRLVRYWYGNNRSVEGLFWEAHRQIPKHATATPLRAFVYLTTGRYAAERHLKVFQRWQEEEMFRRLGVDAHALREARSETD